MHLVGTISSGEELSPVSWVDLKSASSAGDILVCFVSTCVLLLN